MANSSPRPLPPASPKRTPRRGGPRRFSAPPSPGTPSWKKASLPRSAPPRIQSQIPSVAVGEKIPYSPRSATPGSPTGSTVSWFSTSSRTSRLSSSSSAVSSSTSAFSSSSSSSGKNGMKNGKREDKRLISKKALKTLKGESDLFVKRKTATWKELRKRAKPYKEAMKKRRAEKERFIEEASSDGSI